MPGTAQIDLYELVDQSDANAPWVAAVLRSLARVVEQGASDELLLRTLRAHVKAGPFDL